ncbi:MAG: hypothetical protein WDN31_11545 [Hyphomicrobium sp.]
MRDAAGGSYVQALRNTFVPELLSMNCLMAGMVPTVMLLKSHIEGANDPASPRFLVRHVDGIAGRLRRRLSHELVAGGEPSQARHDDGAAGPAAVATAWRARVECRAWRGWPWRGQCRPAPAPWSWAGARQRCRRCR